VDTIRLFDCSIDSARRDIAIAVMAGGQLSSGPNVRELENRLAEYLGRSHVVAMGDATNALALAMRLAGVGPGDSVMAMAYNCLSSTAAIAQCGATPAWVDIDPKRACMSVADCEAAITPRTKALIVYHVAGYPAPMRELCNFSRDHGIVLIEDANCALGAWLCDRKIGSFGDFAVFSFYANRQVNGIDGALLVCPNELTAKSASRLRRYGIDAETFRDELGEINPTSDIPKIGVYSPLNNLNASLALGHLDTLDERLFRVRENVAQLMTGLSGIESIRPISWPSVSKPSFWVWLVCCDRRDHVLRMLKQRGIQCSKLHHPNDAYSGFAPASQVLSGTRVFASEVMGIPCGWWLSGDDISRIVGAVVDICRAE
jgi:dTDP-4-amino-4,6-dideoxygalactose transaminase